MDGLFEPLAIYNAEVARGIVHTPEWDGRMAQLQAEYDDVMAMAATQAAGETLRRMSAEVGMESRPNSGFAISRTRPHCLPGCNRLDGHDGRDAGACMRDGTVLVPGPLDLEHRHPDIPVNVPQRNPSRVP